MSELKLEDVKKLADLAKIEITETEAESYKIDINNILGHLSMVGNAQTDLLNSEFRFVNNLRADDLDKREFDRQIIFDNVPALSNDNYIKVSKVINK